MSWIRDNLFNVLGSALGFGTFGANQINQNKQNRFNAEQAQLNRNFQAEQAQLARDWQEEFYNTYQSPSAMVRQYQDAGLNPALLAGGMNIDSPPSTQTPSGSMASGTAPNYQSVADLVNMVGQMAMLKSEIDKNKSIAEMNRASAFNYQRQGLAANASAHAATADAIYKRSLSKVTDAQFNVVNEQFRYLAAQASNEEFRRNILQLEREIKELQRNQDLDEASFHKQYGFYPNDSLQTAVLKLAQKQGERFKDALARALRNNLPEFTASVPLFNDWVKKRGY